MERFGKREGGGGGGWRSTCTSTKTQAGQQEWENVPRQTRALL